MQTEGQRNINLRAAESLGNKSRSPFYHEFSPVDGTTLLTAIVMDPNIYVDTCLIPASECYCSPSPCASTDQCIWNLMVQEAKA